MTKCADKYRVREYIKEKGLDSILNELYGVWDHAEDIDFSKLPNSFVLKQNNGTGVNIIVTSKAEADEQEIKKKLMQ